MTPEHAARVAAVQHLTRSMANALADAYDIENDVDAQLAMLGIQAQIMGLDHADSKGMIGYLLGYLADELSRRRGRL